MRAMDLTLLCAIALATCPANAAPFDEQSPCAAVVKAFERKDAPAVAAAATVIRDVFDRLDELHTRNGEPGIVARMTDDGVTNLAGVAVAYCREAPKRRLGD